MEKVSEHDSINELRNFLLKNIMGTATCTFHAKEVEKTREGLLKRYFGEKGCKEFGKKIARSIK